jgi:2-polyprenyl-3-methyl-5-hydroxy-6-metoxy-1,4-benzoquinol methylase
MLNDFWENRIDAGYYDRILEEGIIRGRGIQPNWHHSTFSYVKKFIKREDIHLDFACGPGTFIGKYSSGESIGVDISKKQIEYAANKYGHAGNFVTNEEFDFSIYQNYFDKITIIGLLEFLNDDEILLLLDDLHFILKDNGTILLTTPNFKSLMSVFEKIVNLITQVNYKNEHVNKFNKIKMNNLLTKSKFKSVKVIKILNLGVFFGLLGFDISNRIQNIIYKFNRHKSGYLLLGIIKK